MVDISACDLLNYFRNIREEEVLWKCKESRWKFRKENFFGIPKSLTKEDLWKIS